MFSIFKRKYPAQSADFSGLGTDMHSHLLPGIDDGSPDTAMSVQLKRGLEEAGFRQFVTTPHIMWDMYRNTPATIAAALQTVQAEGNHANIRAAAEYYMDDHFDTLVVGSEPLLTITDKKVLVEFSFVAAPLDLKEKLFALEIKGYQPILAHPERYEYLSGRKAMYDELKSMGCLFQLNLLSLAGYYGRVPSELAAWLVAKKYIDFVGTDLHHLRHLQALRHSKHIAPAVSRLLESGKLQNNLLQS
jgi:protein-tyrosine phosphatase